VPEFHYRQAEVGESSYLVGSAGEGPAVLLLHGFPENQYCWRKVAPRLTGARTVVLSDIKGYGYSAAPAGGARGEGYSKRELAGELVELMAQLGHERFAVVGHDRGARVAYRMALDFPERVERACVLNVIPTVEQFERMAAEPSPGYFPFFLLAAPAPLPEQLLTASAEPFLRHTLDDWTAVGDAIDDEAFERYLATFTPANLASICSEYRAAFHIDREHDAADRAAGRRIACPLLVHWGEDDMADSPLPVWERWADDVRGGPLPGGHFVPEEAPDQLSAALLEFLA
jgi:haloacetate dehalogenase